MRCDATSCSVRVNSQEHKYGIYRRRRLLLRGLARSLLPLRPCDAHTEPSPQRQPYRTPHSTRCTLSRCVRVMCGLVWPYVPGMPAVVVGAPLDRRSAARSLARAGAGRGLPSASAAAASLCTATAAAPAESEAQPSTLADEMRWNVQAYQILPWHPSPVSIYRRTAAAVLTRCHLASAAIECPPPLSACDGRTHMYAAPASSSAVNAPRYRCLPSTTILACAVDAHSDSDNQK
jgi:hypothetical protein